MTSLYRSARSLAGHLYRSIRDARLRRAVYSDEASIRTHLDLIAGRIDPSQGPVSLRVKALGDREVFCRPGTSDIRALWDSFLLGHHLPPEEAGFIQTILDLGANVGYTMAHFAVAFPQARILGVELDAGNVALCRRNVEPFGDRCQVLHGAAWVTDGEIPYGGDSEWGFRVMVNGDSISGATRDRVPAYGLPMLLDRLGPTVDYLKMDVEGVEFDLLVDCESWIRRVRWMKVEVHRPRSVSEAIALLRKHGVQAFVDPTYSDCMIVHNTI